jgi:hypothetical protein
MSDRPPHFLLSLSLLSSLVASPALATSFPQATATARLEQRQQQERQITPENYSLSRYPVTETNARYWRNRLWTAATVEPQAEFVGAAIAQILALAIRPNLSAGQMQTVEMAMQVGTQLYLANPVQQAAIGQQLEQLLTQGRNPKWVAMALSGLVNAGATPEQRQAWSDRLRQRFPQWSQNVALYTTLKEVADLDAPRSLPPLNDLLNWQIAPQQPQMYVFCRPNRGVLCRAVLKDGNGQWVQEDGQLWSVMLLGRSLHDLSWNFTRGQTPQGVYRIEGTTPQPDQQYFRAFGQFSLVNLFVPFEPGVRSFVVGQRGTVNTLAAYQQLLPPSWQNYFPMQQTYWAGKAGRGLFRIHGSGEAPDFFTNNRRYPDSAGWNPAIGCLSAVELYDEAGQLQRADMPQILQQLTRAGAGRLAGYLLVVDIPGEETPVTLEEMRATL